MGLFHLMQKQPFNVRLRSIRTSRGLTDLEMAAKLGVDINQYRMYEAGTAQMPNFSIIRASRILNCPELAMNVRGTGGRGPRGVR